MSNQREESVAVATRESSENHNNPQVSNSKNETIQELLVVATLHVAKKKRVIFTTIEKDFKKCGLNKPVFPSIHFKPSDDIDELFMKISMRKITKFIDNPTLIEKEFYYKDNHGEYLVTLYCIIESLMCDLPDATTEGEPRHISMHQIQKYAGAVTTLTKLCAEKTCDKLGLKYQTF